MRIAAGVPAQLLVPRVAADADRFDGAWQTTVSTGALLKCLVRALPVLAVAGCGASPEAGIAQAQHRYLAAKAVCDETYAKVIVQQADCRTRAANAYVRPYYRYGDLMTYAQEQRRALAVQVDRHKMGLATYHRKIAQSEREVAKEEDRRNAQAHVTSSYESTPLTPVISTFARLFN
jgi:hypothetical protein